MDFTQKLAARLTHLRLRRGLSKTAVATLLDVDWRTIHRWETGENFFPVERLPDVARALGVKERMVIPK